MEQKKRQLEENVDSLNEELVKLSAQGRSPLTCWRGRKDETVIWSRMQRVSSLERLTTRPPLCFIEKVHAMEKENEIQTANEVKVSSSHPPLLL